MVLGYSYGLQRIRIFGFSTFILNTIDISGRYCKLNFWPLRDQVKPRHFSDKDRRKGTVFLLFIQISWNNCQETTWTTLLDNDSDLLLRFKPNYIMIILDWITLTLLQTTLTFGFSHTKSNLLNLNIILTLVLNR